MTNTRITDAEILERRYPVILCHFSLRPDSGGSGHFRGGDGVVRELLFRRHITLSVLTERRVFHPYGMNGKLWQYIFSTYLVDTDIVICF
jgi:5-oxoprolinase (ATP-hydrolysing)